MSKKPYRSKFEKWVYQHGGGPRTLADALGVNLSTVYTWFAGRCPKLEVSLIIVELSSGKLTLKDILNGAKK